MNPIKTVAASCLLMLSLAGTQASPVNPGKVGLQSMTGINLGLGQGSTVGWEFTANSNITVTALGFYASTISGSVPVALWSSTGTLLGSTDVSSSGLLNGSYYYDTLTTDISLTAGQTYVLGTYIGFGGQNDPNGAAAFTTAPEISFVQNAYNIGSSLTDPTATDPGQEYGYFAPNFEFTDAAATPEPSTLALTGIGVLLGFAGFQRRRLDIVRHQP